MKCIIVLLAVCLASTSNQAQSAATTPASTLQQQASQAETLYEKHSYAEAAAILEKLSADPRITALPEWPERMYDLACDQAMAGHPAQALATLKQAIDLGSGPYLSSEHLNNDPDLVSLHRDPQFQELQAHLAKREALWKDDPAVATPYRPVLGEDEKVAGLSKFWSEARFNFPFFERIPEVDWDRQYLEYLPQVRAAQTTADYYRIMMRFAATLHDGHTEIWTPKQLRDTLHAMPAFSTQLVEDKVLITEVNDQALAVEGIRVGAEIVSIDGQPVREYAMSAVAPYASGSTPQDRNNRIYGYMLFKGPKDVPVQLTLRDASGETKSASVHRYCEPSSKCTWPGNEPAQFKILPGNIAYLAVNEFEDDGGAKTMRDNFASIAKATGLIIDLRRNSGGNQQNAMAILAMLTDKPFAGVSVRSLNYKPFVRAWGSAPEWLKESAEEVSPNPACHYSKPVIVLAGPGTFSAAENFVVVFDTMHRGTLVGEATPGSTGDSIIFKLPGGGTGRIMMADVEYADGRVFEGVGVPPQVKVSTTVSDIRQGKDAALDRAVEILSATNSTH